MSRARATLALLGCLALGACDAVVGAGGRQLNATIVCTDAGGCACREGLGDCDGIPDNGCETDLNDPKNCGACENDCGNGKCQALACVCEVGYADCDMAVVGCETDLSSDTKHCGSCERDCLGGACKDGLCEPVILANTESAYGFAVNGGSLYYTSVSEPGLFKEPVDGGPRTLFGMSAETGKIVKIAGDTVYWTTGSEVLSTPLAGGTTTSLATGVKPQYQMSVGGGFVYWDDLDAAMPMQVALMRVPAQGGAMPAQVTLLGDIQYLHDFIASQDHVYYNETTTIRRIAHDMTMPEAFTTTPTSATLYAVDSDALFFAGQTSGTYRVEFASAAPEKIADAAPGYGILVTDAESIYFLTSVGDSDPAQAVWRAPKKGGAPAVKLAIDPSMYSGQPMSVDDKWVYWLSLSGVARVPK